MGRIFLVANSAPLRNALALTIQTQGGPTLRIVGTTSWDLDELTTITQAQPTVIVLALGIEGGSELGCLTLIHRFAPASRMLILDTLGEARFRQGCRWDERTVLLRAEDLDTAFVPTLLRLVGGWAMGDGGWRAHQKAKTVT